MVCMAYGTLLVRFQELYLPVVMASWLCVPYCRIGAFGIHRKYVNQADFSSSSLHTSGRFLDSTKSPTRGSTSRQYQLVNSGPEDNFNNAGLCQGLQMRRAIYQAELLSYILDLRIFPTSSLDQSVF